MSHGIEMHAPHQPLQHNWLVLGTVMVGSVAGALSSTTINVAVPAISAQFGLGHASVQWIATAYMLAMTLSMLLTPWLLQRYGLRRSYSCAVVLLMSGGAAGALSYSFPMLLAMRVVEGMAAGVIQPIPAIVILRTFPPGFQGRAMGVYGIGVVMAPAIGPWVGGILIDLSGWRSVLLISAPFCLLVLLLIRRYLPARKGAAHGNATLDWTGLLLIGAGAICLLQGLASAGSGAGDAWGLVAAGCACLIGFVLQQLRRGAGSLLAMGLFKNRPYAMGALVSFTYGMGVFGSTYLLPVYLQLGLHYSPARAGLVLLPAGLVLALTIALAGRLADRFPPHRLVTFGLLLLFLSFALMASGAPDMAYATLIGLAILGRIGLGFILPALSLGAMRGVDAAQVAQGATALGFLRQLGGAIGVSVVGIVLEWRVAVHEGAGAATSPAGHLRPFHETLAMIAVLCALAIAAAWRMRAAPPEN